MLAINTQLGEFTSQKDSSPAFRALTIQKKRLTDEYLLRELASGGFLPGYGFPTNVVSFDMLNIDELKRQEQRARYQQQASLGREDNKMRHRELPSRDAVTKLYVRCTGRRCRDGWTGAPRSAGITLNGMLPPPRVKSSKFESIRQAVRLYIAAQAEPSSRQTALARVRLVVRNCPQWVRIIHLYRASWLRC